MAERIPQSVSYLVVFRAFLASDGKTPATGKTIAITLSKNGATSFSNPNAGATNATEMASGFYKFTLDTTDTGTAGPLAWRGAEGAINDAGDVLTVANAHNAGFDGLPNAVAAASGGVPIIGTGVNNFKSDASANVTTTQAFPTNFSALSITAGGVVKSDVDTIKTNPVVNAGTVTFPTGATLASTTNITGGTITTVTTTTTATNLTNLPSIPANWITAAGIAASALNGKGDWLLSSGYTAPPSAATNAAAVWDLDTTGHTTAGTFGAAMSAAGSAGDPWTTALPGAYVAGTAGKILGDVATGVKLGDVAHGGTSTTITFARMIGASTTLNQPCVKLTGNGTGAALQASAETSSFGNGVRITASGLNAALHVENSSGGGALFQGGTGVGLFATATNGVGMRVSAGGSAGNTGMEILGAGGGGTGLMLEGGAGSGPDLELFSSLAPTLRDAILTSALTEGYRAAGATASVRDMLYELIAHMGDSSIASTTKTLKKLNGTTAKTFTLDSATAPTSITEAT